MFVLYYFDAESDVKIIATSTEQIILKHYIEMLSKESRAYQIELERYKKDVVQIVTAYVDQQKHAILHNSKGKRIEIESKKIYKRLIACATLFDGTRNDMLYTMLDKESLTEPIPVIPAPVLPDPFYHDGFEIEEVPHL
jgi:hypothetical protein